MADDVIYLRNRRFPQGAWVPRSEAWVSPDDRGFVFGDGVYEVVRIYAGNPFMLPEHLGRLERSLRGARIEVADLPSLIPCIEELLRVNQMGAADAMVYLQVTRGEAPRSHAFPHPPVPPTIFMAVAPGPDNTRVQTNGACVVTLSDFRWSRCDIKTIALQANVLALQHARERDADECLFVRDGMVTEGTHTNFFGVLNGVVRTHPATNHILPGITRACVLDLCRQEGIECAEVAVTEMDLLRLDEAFITATSYEVTPIIAVNGKPVGDGRPGPVTQRIQDRFRVRTRGGTTDR